MAERGFVCVGKGGGARGLFLVMVVELFFGGYFQGKRYRPVSVGIVRLESKGVGLGDLLCYTRFRNA